MQRVVFTFSRSLQPLRLSARNRNVCFLPELQTYNRNDHAGIWADMMNPGGVAPIGLPCPRFQATYIIHMADSAHLYRLRTRFSTVYDLLV